MRILTATPAPAPLEDDFCDATTGEIVIPHGLVCTNPEKAARCGCERTHIGLSSRQSTTTVLVSETDWEFDQLVAVCRDHIIESNGIEVFGADAIDDISAALIAQSIEVATDHHLGMILRPRFDHEREQWFYNEATE